MRVTVMPKVSVVIPTFNRADKLRDCLHGLSQQSMRDFEIIIVDDASTDGTSEVVSAFVAAHPALRISTVRLEKNRGCATARNEGINRAVGEVVFFTDDDCVVPSNWLEVHMDAHARYPDAIGVGGWYWPHPELLQKNVYHRFFRAVFAYYLDLDTEEIYGNTMSVPSGNTANQSYKRKVFDDGFRLDQHIHFSGNVDWDFKQQVTYAGFNFLYIPFHVFHNRPMGLWEFARICIRRGRGRHYRYQKFVSAYPVVLEPLVTLRGILQSYLQYARSKKIARDIVPIFLLYDFFTWVGKLVNLITGFAPKQKIAAQGGIVRFRKWYKNGVLQREEAWVPYLFTDFYHLRSSEQEIGDDSVRISIIVPVFNRAATIVLLLDYLCRQSLPQKTYEVIVVDDGSTDGTSDVVAKYVGEHSDVQLRCLVQANAGPAAARNHGARIAKGEMLFFIDSDVVPGVYWLRMHMKVWEQFPALGAVYGGQRVVKNLTLFDQHRNATFHNRFPVSSPDLVYMTNNTTRRIPAFDTANMSIKREVFLSLEGFDEGFKRPAHEDVEFSYRLQAAGFAVALVPNFVTAIRSQSMRDFVHAIRVRHQWKPLLLSKFCARPDDYDKKPLTLRYLLVHCLSFLMRPSKFAWVAVMNEMTEFYFEKRSGNPTGK